MTASSLLVAATGCSRDALSEDEFADSDSDIADESDFRAVEVGARLRVVTLARVQRSATALAARAASLASVLAQSSCSASQATNWAQAAVVKRSVATISTPFSCDTDIQVSYQGYYDRLIVKDKSSSFPVPSTMFQVTSAPRPDTGIGQAAARGIASQFFTSQLIPTGLVDSSWVLLDGSRLVDGVVDIAGNNSGSRVREFRFAFRRHIHGFPIIDTLLEVSVDSSGIVRGLILADVSSTTGGTSIATRSEATAQNLFGQAAEARADSWDPSITATIRRFRAGYVLPYDLESFASPPVLRGEIVYKRDVIASPVEDATLSFVQPSPSLNVMVPWAGDASPPAAQNGQWCGRDDQCASGHCFMFAGYYGVCGNCADGADCASGSCNPPNPAKSPVVPSTCGSGGVAGNGCETNSDCATGLSCQTVLTGALGASLRTCSSCATDAGCSAGSRCAPNLDWATNKASRACVTNGSLALGRVCMHDASCASGRCAPYIFPDGTEVGVCSACETQAHCGTGTCVSPSFEVGAGFLAGACQ